MPIFDRDTEKEVKEFGDFKKIKKPALKEMARFFLDRQDKKKAVFEFPCKEWEVSENNLATRLSEYAKDVPKWLDSNFREGKSYKEWYSIKTDKNGQGILI